MKTWKKVALGVLCTLLSLAVLIAGSIALLINKGSSELLSESYIVTAPDGVETQDGGDYVVYNGHTYQLNKKVTSILCMGIDKRDLGKTSTGTGGGQADAIILIAVDTSNGNTTMINISRDTMTDVSVYSAGGSFVDTETMQICLSYAYGDGEESSCENTVSSVQRLFYNIPINSYMSLDLDGISAINDSIGGVDVVSPETIGDFVQGKTYHLEGDLTEAFVRTRDTSQLDSNNGRMQRQQTYLSAFISNFVEQTKEDISTPLSLYNTASPYVCTNINSSRVVYLAQNIVLNGGLSTDIKTIPGTVEEGEEYAEFYVDETEFYEMFLSIYYTQIS
ncbi:MAG: LCP family protein [Clostridiales bacterium]|nr:LCP family protein [Clostridiales bacterium]